MNDLLDNPDAARLNSPPLQDGQGRAILSTVIRYDKNPRWFVFWRLGSSGPVILGISPATGPALAVADFGHGTAS